MISLKIVSERFLFGFFFRLIGQRHKVFHTFCTCLTLPFPDDTVKIPWPSFLKFQRHELMTYWFRGQNAKSQRHVTVYCKTWTLPFFSAFINTNSLKGLILISRSKGLTLQAMYYVGGGKKFPDYNLHIVFGWLFIL